MRKFLAAGLLCVPLLLLPGSALRAQQSQSGYLAQANDHANRGQYSAAKAEIAAAIAIDPNQAEAWYQLGLLYGQTAEYRDAEEDFRRALTLDPNSARIHCRLGQTLVAEPEVREDWAGAVAEFRAALKLDPDYPEAESLLGLGLMHLGDRMAAIATLRHAIQLHPAEASAHLNLALALEEQPEGQEEAVDQYRAALQVRPDAAETRASLGILLLRLDRLPEAEAAFRAALQLDPDLQDANFGLAKVLKAEKKTTEAAIEFDLTAELQQRKPDGTQAIQLNNESMQRAAKGDLPGAIAGLQRAILLKPDYGIAKYNLGLILADSGEFDAAKEQLIDAVSLLSGEAKVWFDLGRVFARLGDHRSAVEAVAWATRLSPADPRFAEELKELRSEDSSADHRMDSPSGESAKGPGDTPSRPPAFGAASDTLPDRLTFAKALKERGDLQGALGELLRALKLAPNSVEARRTLAEVYAAQLRWDRAIEEYRKVLLVAGQQDASTHLALGSALFAAGHAKEAADEFEAVLKIEPESKSARAGLSATRRALSHP